MQQLLTLLMFYALFFLAVGIFQVLYKRFNVGAEVTRKLLHLSGGILALCVPFFFDSLFWVTLLLILPVLFMGITYLLGRLPSIHRIKRYSLGSILFPIPAYICFVAMHLSGDALYFYLPVSVVTFADSAAQLGGEKWGHRTLVLFQGKKTVAGSLSFFVVSILCGLVCFSVFSFPLSGMVLLQILVISLVSTLTEMVSFYGSDNVTVPLVIFGLLAAMAQM